jgi:hypothetical protein
MAVLSKEEFTARVQKLVGEDNSDEAIQNLEDLTDTYNNLETVKSGEVDWEARFKENDAMWSKKYRDRFSEPAPEDKDKDKDKHKEEDEKSIDDLFK